MPTSNIVIGNPVDFRAQSFSDFAAALIDDGTSFLPITLDGSKSPDGAVLPIGETGKRVWKPLESRLPTSDEMKCWFGNGKPRGIGIIHGRLSPGKGARELLDLDVKGNERRSELASQFLDDERIRNIIVRCPVVATPSGGFHVYYRCEKTEGNQVLAKVLDDKAEDGRTKAKTFIETRGDGGYSAAPPTPGYRLVNLVPITQTPTFTPEERELLFTVAREFSEVVTPTKRQREAIESYEDPDPTRPGSIFNRVASWQDILEPKGWHLLYSDGEIEHWRTPEKHEDGASATTNYMGSDLLYVFSSNASPFEAEAAYSKFAAFAILYHEGDFSAAAGDVAERGFNETDFFDFGDPDQIVEQMTADYHAVQIEDGGDELAEGERVEQHGEKVCTDAKVFPDLKDDPLYAYLWRGEHGRYVTDQEREKRINSTREVLQFVPSKSIFTDYLAYVMPTTDAPVWFHLAGALSVASHLINRRAYLTSGLDIYYPNLWIGVIAESGQRKSSALNPARDLLREDSHYGQTLPDSFTFASLMQDLGMRIRDEYEEAELPTLLEARAMCQHDEGELPYYTQGIGYFCFSEIATFLATLAKSYNEEAKATITDWYDCPKERVKKTTTQGKLYLYKPYISIFGASTVHWLVQGCRESDMLGGFLPRWLFFTNTEQDFSLSERDAPDPQIRERLTADCQKLKAYRGDVTYGDEAKDCYHEWYHAFIKDTDALVTPWLPRLTVYAKKIALVFEAATTGENIVSAATNQLACKLVSKLKDDLAKMLHEQMAFNEVDRLCKRLVQIVKANGGRVEHSAALRNLNTDARTMNMAVVPTACQKALIVREEVKAKNGKMQVFYSTV